MDEQFERYFHQILENVINLCRLFEVTGGKIVDLVNAVTELNTPNTTLSNVCYFFSFLLSLSVAHIGSVLANLRGVICSTLQQPLFHMLVC